MYPHRSKQSFILLIFLSAYFIGVNAGHHKHQKCNSEETSFQLCRHNSKCSKQFYLTLATVHWDQDSTHIVSTPHASSYEKKVFSLLYSNFIQTNSVPSFFLDKHSHYLCKPVFYNFPVYSFNDDDDDDGLPPECNITISNCKNMVSIADFQYLWLKYLQTNQYCDVNEEFILGVGCRCKNGKICKDSELNNANEIVKFSGLILGIFAFAACFWIVRSISELTKTVTRVNKFIREMSTRLCNVGL